MHFEDAILCCYASLFTSKHPYSNMLRPRTHTIVVLLPRTLTLNMVFIKRLIIHGKPHLNFIL